MDVVDPDAFDLEKFLDERAPSADAHAEDVPSTATRLSTAPRYTAGTAVILALLAAGLWVRTVARRRQ